jgi:hypothetical protein
MKIVVLVPSKEYRASAGSRIRYGRIGEGLEELGIKLELVTIGDFDPRSADCDILVISKCHDARSLLAAAAISARGKLVGVDLFDDYFSQIGDSRLNSYREWLASLLQDCDFALTSTMPLSKVVQDYRADLPTHVVNDPAPSHAPGIATLAAEQKFARARREGILDVTWFGVGDNPFFQVGLSDLAGHRASLANLERSGLKVRLKIVTNSRSLNTAGLELISRLPVQSKIVEWSEEAEAAALDDALVAFLPVAAQPFSAAKSLNRALTSLARGCEVLTVGYPLYAALEPLIYSNSDDLVADLSTGTLRFSRANIGVYEDKLRQLASSETEAVRLRDFLGRLSAPAVRDTAKRLCVIHGFSTRIEVHRMTQSLGALSVASPFCSAKLDFDVFFRGLPPNMDMDLATAGESRRSRARLGEIAPFRNATFPYQMLCYNSALKEMEARLVEKFGPLRLILSDTSRLPVRGFNPR